MSYTYSAVLITPADQLENADKVSVAIGHGLNNFTLPASSNGTNVTHLYCHAWCNEVFDSWVNGLASGQPPEGDWEAAGLTFEEAMLTLSRMAVSCREGADPPQHVAEVLTANNLQVISDVVQVPAEPESVQSVSTLDKRSGDTGSLRVSRL
jgi:hypothetical protein